MYKKKIALYGKKTTSTSLVDVMPEFIKFLSKNKVEYQVESSFFNELQSIKEIDLSGITTFNSHQELWEDLDYFFTFGGDGTILSAITYVRDSNLPIVGVNTGRLGYLACINKKELISNLENIFQENYRLSKRLLLEVLPSQATDIVFPFALNELAIMRKETTSMITIDAYLNGELLNSFWADGLIVATPTGSTGYSLSCNGPIIAPNNSNFVITPVAPHNLNVRPIVIADKDVLHLKVHSRVPEYSLSLDSRLVSINTTTEIKVKRAAYCINIVELNSGSYLKTLREKLFWGADNRN